MVYLGISCHWRSRTRRLFHGAKLQACGCYRDPNRDFLWRRGWIFRLDSLTMLISNMFMGQGPWTPLADVCLWHDRISGRDPVPEGDFKSQEVRSLYLWIFERSFNLWRHYESCQHPDVLRVHYKSSLIAYYISGAPVDLVHAASTVIFLAGCLAARFWKSWSGSR
ncbi:MAG: hypothetical protein ACLURP_01665 [Ruminococcus sp.]